MSGCNINFEPLPEKCTIEQKISLNDLSQGENRQPPLPCHLSINWITRI